MKTDWRASLDDAKPAKAERAYQLAQLGQHFMPISFETKFRARGLGGAVIAMIPAVTQHVCGRHSVQCLPELDPSA